MKYTIFLIPIISTLVGWVTNFLAVKMLFHPRKPKKIIFFIIQGVIPKRIDKLSESIGIMVSEKLLDKDVLKEKLFNIEDNSVVMEYLETKLEEALKKEIETLNPMVKAFISDEIILSIKSKITKGVELALPDILDKIGEQSFSNLDLTKEVRERVKGFDPKQVEDLFWGILKKELKFVEILGAIVGFLIGIFQLSIALF